MQTNKTQRNSNRNSVAMTERHHELGSFKGWVSLRLNFRLMVTFRANSYGSLDRGMVILQLCCWKSECPFVWYQNICSALFGFVTKHTYEGQTDGRTELRQLIPASIAACAVKTV